MRDVDLPDEAQETVARRQKGMDRQLRKATREQRRNGEARHEDHRDDHPIRVAPTHGYAATREDAMAAFAKSWRRQ
jgi:hypothetical protein